MTCAAILTVLAAAPQGPYDDEISAAIADVAWVYAVPPALVRAVIRQESNFDPRAHSKAGAIGLMQVMPFNAPKVGLSEKDLWDPAKNILAGVRLLAVLLKHYKGDLISVLAAYNARPRALFAPLPRNGETPAYVARVLGFFREYSNPAPALAPGPPAEARRSERALSKSPSDRATKRSTQMTLVSPNCSPKERPHE